METNAKPFYLTEKENDQLEKWLSSLSLEQKVGQLFCVLGDLYDEEKTKELVYDKAIGGVLFRPASLGELQKRYQKLDALAEIPLFKAANLEDGADGAILEGKRYSSELGVAACNDKAFARELALSSSFEARKAGINITFSPDSDIDFNFLNPITNERTFGSSPSRVRELVREEIQGFLDNGILPTIKHFPGDGVDFRDQHLLPSVNSLSYSSWLRSYGSVYKSAILAGVPCVMVGHIAAPKVAEALDPSLTKK
jgi:beta-N-acetylhexosaminidase